MYLHMCAYAWDLCMKVSVRTTTSHCHHYTTVKSALKCFEPLEEGRKGALYPLECVYGRQRMCEVLVCNSKRDDGIWNHEVISISRLLCLLNVKYLSIGVVRPSAVCTIIGPLWRSWLCLFILLGNISPNNEIR